MDKTFTKGLFILLLPLLVITAATSAQTITVGAVDPGPYGRGSSISVPFKVTGCITDPTNIYTLYLSDAAGNFGAPTAIGTYPGFYATFINGVIPNGVSASGNYKVRISSSKPVTTSAASAPFTINAVAGLKAAMTSPQTLTTNVFGQCAGADRTFNFTNTSDGNAPATATFFNELTQANEGGVISIDGNFAATTANYTVTERAVSGGIVGTKSYQLINNVSNNSFTITGNGSVCLGAGNTLDYNVDISGNNGIQKNYPGLTYDITWGDGTTSVYTLCEIVAANGKVSHAYTSSSCGNVAVANQRKNVFQIDIQPKSPYCANITQPVTTYARVLALPQNSFNSPIAACLNNPVTFNNTSIPGDDPNSTALNCKNLAATYTWLVDGVIKATGRTLSQPFVNTFTTNGIHKVTLRYENNSGACDAPDKTLDICIQKSPQPSFTIPSTYCLATGPLTPGYTSVVDENCNTNTTYNWVLVSGPSTGVSFTPNIEKPVFNFSQIGVYRFKLDITTLSCGLVSSPVQTIVVNDVPKVQLSADANVCGQGVTLSFDPTATTTKSNLTGTAQPVATTYTWAVTGGAFTFVGGTDLHSQYPKIRFDALAAYTITATHVNSCGAAATDQQVLTFVQSPTVVAGTYNPVCEGTPIVLNGTPGVGGLVTGVTWLSTTGGTFTNQNTPNATYTPSAADIAAGQVILRYQVTTSLTLPCNVITDQTTVTIIKKATIISPNNPSVCSGNTFNYNITAVNPATIFTWTAAVTSGTATGYTTPGSGNAITDIITNSTNTDAVVTYTIIPTLNGCPGTPFSLKVTVHPLPGITAIPVDASICSNQPANITLTSNITPTTYTWTSVASAGITGNTNRTVPSSAPAGIQDLLVNNSGVSGTVTYKITPYNGTCPGTPKQAVVSVKPAPIQSVAGPDEAICISSNYTLQGNDPVSGTGKWTVTSGQAGITFSNNADPHAVVSGLLPGQIYKFTWTITAAPTCPSTQSTVTITNNAEAVGGTTAGTATVCAPTNNGTITLSGYIGAIIRWERSINNGTNWLPVVNTTATLNYSNLTQTTQYRAVLSGGSCGNEFSTATTITVNQPALIANAGPDNPQCNVTSVNLQGNSPGAFVGVWTQIAGPAATIVTPADPLSQVTGLVPGNSYTFRWTIKGVLPCGDSFDDVVVINGSNVTAAFTPSVSQACGTTSVAFTNNTTPVLPGTIYEWDFGDGSPVSHLINPTHPFQPTTTTDGKDITYHVKLTIIGNCVPSQHIEDITISPATPVALIAPPDNSQNCGALNLTLHNLSQGNNASYDFYLVDENFQPLAHVGPLTDKSDAVFPQIIPLKSALWHVYIIATNKCGGQNLPDYRDIPVAASTAVPGIQIKDGITAVCLGTPVVFQNISAGGDSFTYNVYDAALDKTTQFAGGLADFPYIFPHAGNYQVSITARNNACTSAPPSTLIPIQVYPLPQPQFTYTVDVDNKVKFVNTTPAAGSTPAASLTYVWNFGDSTAPETTFTPNDHSYDYTKSPYTVTLTARNPGTSCEGTVTHTIEIKFTGELFLPNAFQPESSKTELRTFKAKGQKLKEWRMQVFNNWGQLVWQTTALSSNGEPTEGWDGTFKGASAQQGVYIWQITAKFLNGSDWKGMSYNGSLPKRSGTINLIR